MRALHALLNLVFPERDDARLARETTIRELFALCRAPRAGLPGLLPYQNPRVRALMREAKYREDQHAAKLLGAVLERYLEDAASKDTVIVPIPLSFARKRERGFNQVERIIEHARAARMPRPFPPVVPLLSRTRHTKKQTDLRRADRRKNMHGAFRVQGKVDENASYLVIDDVTTTGATLADALRAMREAGATRVALLALAA